MVQLTSFSHFVHYCVAVFYALFTHLHDLFRNSPVDHSVGLDKFSYHFGSVESLHLSGVVFVLEPFLKGRLFGLGIAETFVIIHVQLLHPDYWSRILSTYLYILRFVIEFREFLALLLLS